MKLETIELNDIMLICVKCTDILKLLFYYVHSDNFGVDCTTTV